MPDTRVFRALHFPHRRREVVSNANPTPINVQPGEVLYDEAANKLYAGLEDTTAVQIGGGNAGSNNYVESDITGLTGGTVLTNIVKITQAGYNALATKDPATVYYIVSG
jgi:hypothetical protein